MYVQFWLEWQYDFYVNDGRSVILIEIRPFMRKSFSFLVMILLAYFIAMKIYLARFLNLVNTALKVVIFVSSGTFGHDFLSQL